MKARREREHPSWLLLLRVAAISGLSALALLASGCGGSLRMDSRMKTRGNMRAYEKQLEERLAARYNNLPDWAGKISKVDLVLTRLPEKSVDKKEIRAEFSQLVYDKWGERVPLLEKEYYIVTFGYGHPRVVRTDPSIKLGLDIEGGFSERFPADPTKAEPAPCPQAPVMPATPAKPKSGMPQDADDNVPVVPAAPEDLLPTRITQSPAAVPAKPEPSAPRLLRGMAAPRLPNGRIPHTHVRNLPVPLPQPEID